jgi:hypothetical protein
MASSGDWDDKAWLRERGWVPDRNAWRLMTDRRVRICSFVEACKFQRRSDAAKRSAAPATKEGKAK